MDKLTITEIKIINEKLQTAEGEIKAPIRFVMELEADNGSEYSVPISIETYTALTKIYSEG